MGQRYTERDEECVKYDIILVKFGAAFLTFICIIWWWLTHEFDDDEKQMVSPPRDD